ncbi:hypothetical protein BY458DRAFT_590289 [Sporodiniella umbellata]|nr:hypothetical protein BY458DRAFT_590289 [Sporodiniella umbellata]
MTQDNSFYFDCTSSQYGNNYLLFDDIVYQQDLSQPPLTLDNDPSSCQSSPNTLYETTVLKKQVKKKTINSELKRQVHIQSEQKRRAQIKDGFDELRNELPVCVSKKMSKVALLHKTVQHIQHLKSAQVTFLAEVERLTKENSCLRKFKEATLQSQAMEKMYPL